MRLGFVWLPGVSDVRGSSVSFCSERRPPFRFSRMKLTIVELLGSCCLNPLVFLKLAKILATRESGHPVAICVGQTFFQIFCKVQLDDRRLELLLVNLPRTSAIFWVCVNVCDRNCGVQIDAFKKPIQMNTMMRFDP